MATCPRTVPKAKDEASTWKAKHLLKSDECCSKNLNQTRSTCLTCRKFTHFVLLLLCLFLGISVVHLKAKQNEIEEKLNVLSVQVTIVFKCVVGHGLSGNAQAIFKNNISEEANATHFTNTDKRSNLMEHSLTSTNPFTAVNKGHNTQSLDENADPSLVNTNSGIHNYLGISKFRRGVTDFSDSTIVDKRNLNVDVIVGNSSSPNQETNSVTIPKKRQYTTFSYKSVNTSRVFKNLFSFVPLIESIENDNVDENWKENPSKQTTVGKLLSRVVRSNRKKGKRHGQLQPKNEKAHRCKKLRDCGPLSLHFKGGVPERTFQDGGIITPWFQDKMMSGSDETFHFEIKDGGLLEVLEAGMYLIYAQVYYLTTEVHNSFAINVMESGKRQTLLALCSTNSCARGQGFLAEVSCFTSVVRYLNASDQVFVLQRERNRRILMRDGQSFLGLVKLNK